MSLEFPPWAVMTPKRKAHVERVALLLDEWARARGLEPHERSRHRRAAVLHDALKDAGDDVLARYEPQGRWPHAVWHGPAAAAAAAREGEADAGILDAVRYHSLGWADWDDVGKSLYLADFLEPGRAHRLPEDAALVARVPADLDGVLREVASARIGHLHATGAQPAPETLDFWHRLTRDVSPSS
jgi:HD superfamily phosphohydrolase YqeK